MEAEYREKTIAGSTVPGTVRAECNWSVVRDVVSLIYPRCLSSQHLVLAFHVFAINVWYAVMLKICTKHKITLNMTSLGVYKIRADSDGNEGMPKSLPPATPRKPGVQLVGLSQRGGNRPLEELGRCFPNLRLRLPGRRDNTLSLVRLQVI